MAEQMKTWDSTCQLVPWDDLAASILRGDRTQSDLGCIYKEGHDWGHLQSSVGVYPKIVHKRYIKKGRSDTPLS